MKIFNHDHAPLAIEHHATRLKVGERLVLKGWWLIGSSKKNASPPVRIIILRLKTGELVTIASGSRPQRALAIYRKRWKMETLFAGLKTRVFNLESTYGRSRKTLDADGCFGDGR